MLNRNFTIIINWILENLLPPICREWRWLMYIIIYPAYGKHTNLILDFKEKLPFLSEDEINEYYAKITSAPIYKRPTDLNTQCIEYLLNNLKGEKIIDCGSGRGYLVNLIAKNSKYEVFGADIEPYDVENVTIIKSGIENLTFEDAYFDTVLCCHTLEHIVDYKLCIDNLIRICKKRLIIVMPCQRNYKYTADLHVHFLPYMHDFQRFVGIKNANYLFLKGDFVCIFDKCE